MQDGYIKLHRKMTEWQWYSDPNTKIVFLHILFLATHKPVKYKKFDLKPGQAVITIRKLADDLGLSVRNVRTALDNLEATHELTRETTHSFTLVTVENWALYQSDESEMAQQTTHELTGKRHTERKERKEAKERKENKNINNIYIAVIEHLNRMTGQRYKPTTKATQDKIDARLNEGFTLDDFIAVIDKKTAQWKDDPKMSEFLRPQTLFGTKFESYLNYQGGDYGAKQDTGNRDAANDAEQDYSGVGSGFKIAT